MTFQNMAQNILYKILAKSKKYRSDYDYLIDDEKSLITNLDAALTTVLSNNSKYSPDSWYCCFWSCFGKNAATNELENEIAVLLAGDAKSHLTDIAFHNCGIQLNHNKEEKTCAVTFPNGLFKVDELQAKIRSLVSPPDSIPLITLQHT